MSFEASSIRRTEAQAGSFGLSHLSQLVIDQIDCGLLVCDSRGRILHSNRAATRELSSGQVINIQDGRLCGQGPVADELAGAIQGAAHGRRRLVRAGHNPPLMLVVMPLGSVAGTESLVLVMIGRRTLCTALGLELLSMKHHLTWAEQRVFRGLVAGVAARDIAAENGVAVSTVRTQIQSIREKVGVDNIDALLLTAARVPPVPSCH